jgi:hypothetical protein
MIAVSDKATAISVGKSELQIFGDESTADGLVTYGLVAFANSKHERDTRYAWSNVLRKFGGNGRSKIHCRTLFSGQARQKTEWSESCLRAILRNSC